MNKHAPIFSETVDLLLQWGRIHLINPDNAQGLKQPETDWELSDLSSVGPGLAKLREKVDGSLDFLHGPATVDIVDGQKARIMAELKILDLTVFLAESVEYFSGSEKVPDASRQNAESLLQYVTIDRELSYPRLIPLNRLRLEALGKIPENARWLFPWYAVWAEISEDFTDVVSDWRGRFSAERLQSLIPDKDLAGALLADVVSDSALLSRIRKEARLFESLADVAQGSFALRMFAMWERCEGDTVSETIAEKAVEMLAAKAVTSPQSEMGDLERLFLVAFCGSGLDERKRTDIFEHVGKEIERPNISMSNQNVAQRIRSWDKGETEDNAFAEELRKAWDDLISAEIAEEPQPLNTVADRLLKGEITDSVTSKADIPDHGKSAESFFGSVFRIFPMKAFATAAVLLAVLFISHIHDFPILMRTAPIGPEMTKPVSKHIEMPTEKQLPEILLDELYVGAMPEETISEKRPDPFVPLLKNESARVKKMAVSPARIELGEFRLVAIILFPGRNRALLEDASGKGHIVEKGTYIGGNRRVAAIMRDRIIIEEKSEDAFGNTSTSKTGIRLPSDASEIDTQ